jgi:hypothetical protein
MMHIDVDPYRSAKTRMTDREIIGSQKQTIYRQRKVIVFLSCVVVFMIFSHVVSVVFQVMR